MVPAASGHSDNNLINNRHFSTTWGILHCEIWPNFLWKPAISNKDITARSTYTLITNGRGSLVKVTDSVSLGWDGLMPVKTDMSDWCHQKCPLVRTAPEKAHLTDSYFLALKWEVHNAVRHLLCKFQSHQNKTHKKCTTDSREQSKTVSK